MASPDKYSHKYISPTMLRRTFSGALKEVTYLKKSLADSCLQEVVNLVRKARVCALNTIIGYLVL